MLAPGASAETFSTSRIASPLPAAGGLPAVDRDHVQPAEHAGRRCRPEEAGIECPDVRARERLELVDGDPLPGAEVASLVEAERAVGVADLVGRSARRTRLRAALASEHAVGEPGGCGKLAALAARNVRAGPTRAGGSRRAARAPDRSGRGPPRPNPTPWTAARARMSSPGPSCRWPAGSLEPGLECGLDLLGGPGETHEQTVARDAADLQAVGRELRADGVDRRRVGPNRLANAPGGRYWWNIGELLSVTSPMNRTSAALSRGLSTISPDTDADEDTAPSALALAGTRGVAPIAPSTANLRRRTRTGSPPATRPATPPGPLD